MDTTKVLNMNIKGFEKEVYTVRFANHTDYFNVQSRIKELSLKYNDYVEYECLEYGCPILIKYASDMKSFIKEIVFLVNEGYSYCITYSDSVRFSKSDDLSVMLYFPC